MGRMTLVTGGARSGKSDFAERLAHELGGGEVLFVATAEARDEDMAARIAAHRAARPRAWRTAEAPRGVGRVVAAATATVVLVDCLTLLVSNVLLANGDDPDPTVARAAVDAEVADLLDAARTGAPELILVTNEVGLGIVPENRLARLYRDMLGRANAAIAREADRVYLLVAGLAVDIKALSRLERTPLISPRTLALLLAAAVGCGGPHPTAPTPPPATSPAIGFPREVADGAGYTLTLTARPARIVSTAPSNTEILFAIGAGSQLVGVTTYCTYPPEAKAVEKVGGFSPKAISTEVIVGLRPDLVLTTGRLQQGLTESLRKLGLPVLSFDAQTLGEVTRNVRLLGKATGTEEAADALADRLDRRAKSVQARFAGLHTDQRPRVLLLLSDAPLMTVGPKTFAGEMVELAGGVNLFADAEQQFPRVSEEEILRRNPDVAVLWEFGEAGPRKERLALRPGWADLGAFRAGRVVSIHDDLLSRASPRLFDGLEQMADRLHPR